MRITRIETFHVRPRWLFVEIETSKGVTGYGEPVVEGQSRVVARMVEQLAEYLVGKDPLDIQRHWQHMYRSAFYRGGPILVSAISGIEQALWDIKGKHLNAPVYDMLGGAVRSKIRMYPHVDGATVTELADSGRRAVARGFTVVKTGLKGPVRMLDTRAYIDSQVERFASLRNALGPQIDIAIDFHGRVDPAMANLLIDALEPFTPLFVEEPCLPERPAELGRIAARTSVPIAAGERVFTKYGFAELIREKAVAVLQPDLCHVGGIFEGRLVAAMAEADYLSVAPHNPLGPISLAACLQLDATIPNFLVQEHPGLNDGRDLGVGIIVNPFEIRDGHVDLPTGPGLGVEVDAQRLREEEFDGRWASPYYELEDGSFANW